ncbi:NAD-dependent epimerase/dehydratase family protein [Nocardia sp. NBC_01377]|uniref:NAD-dependent epimerase/dehydratase family protein n=1 Tax=Nocardia sp. NBC_01377 TaxID=2903595 RepID=UPI00325237CC
MTTRPTHVVLGGNGVIGRETLRALLNRGENAASVGRRPSTVEGARSITADLLVAEDVSRAVAGAHTAYLTAGLPYSARIWAEQWPVIVANAIEAALTHDIHLVYFDNVYAYGRVEGSMTEQTPINPAGKKGRVRADALRALATAAAERGLVYTVGRSADFYGPGATTSVFNTFALDKIAVGKDGTWLYDADKPHSLTFTPDIGNALTILGADPAARGSIWHLPTAAPLTGRQYIELAAGSDARVKVMSCTTMRIGALFNSGARETLEMGYQYTAPYVFDSNAFETTFSAVATLAAEGIAVALAFARNRIPT